tara:strand:+ start:3386 stop:4900 length:1515 start_codon:yes stop_codon:yes gene_type:complete
MNIAQIHERVKNLSDPQLVEMSQRGDTTASLALMELNARNDMREASIQPMGEPPTIAEQEASKAMQGIGAPPIDPNMITPEMLGGIGSPDMMPQPQPMGSGVGQLPAPMMMAAGGGLIELAEGGLPELEEGYEYGPSRYEGIKDYFRGPNPIDFLTTGESYGDMARYFRDNPREVLGAGAKAGLGVLGLGKFKVGAKLLRPLGDKIDTLIKQGTGGRFRKFAKDPSKGEGFLERNLKNLYTSRQPMYGVRKFDPKKAALATSIGTIAADEGGDFLFDPRVKKIGPTGAEKAKDKKDTEALAEKSRLAALKAAQEQAAKGGSPEASPEASPEKGGLGGFLAGISPEAWQGIGLAGAQLYSGATAGEAAEKGIAATMGAKKARAAREAAKADAEYKKSALKLEEMQIKLVAQTARDKLGWSQEKLEKAKAKYLTEGEGRGIAGEVKKEIEAGRGWFSGKLDDDAVNEAIRKEQNVRWNRYLLDLQGSAAGLELLRQLTTEIDSRKE